MSKSEIARRVEGQAVLLVKALGKQVEHIREMDYGFPRQDLEEEVEPILRALRARVTNLINQLHTKDLSIEQVMTAQFHMELDRQTRQAQRAKQRMESTARPWPPQRLDDTKGTDEG